MSPFSCPREPETIRAAWSGNWRASCNDDLRRHVGSCRVCREAVELAAAFREDREAAIAAARVPASGLVWWRAQLRARREAAAAAERPVALAHALAVVAALAALGAVARTALPSAGRLFGVLGAGQPAPAEVAASLHGAGGALVASAWSLLAQPGIPIVLAGTLVLAPVALYLALARD
jgi:hypothetical protein